jgi:hypothetical protein
LDGAEELRDLVGRLEYTELPKVLQGFYEVFYDEEVDRPKGFDQRVVELCWELLEADPGG